MAYRTATPTPRPCRGYTSLGGSRSWRTPPEDNTCQGDTGRHRWWWSCCRWGRRYRRGPLWVRSRSRCGPLYTCPTGRLTRGQRSSSQPDSRSTRLSWSCESCVQCHWLVIICLFQIFHPILFFTHTYIYIYICLRLVCVLHVNRVLISFIYLFILFIVVNSI